MSKIYVDLHLHPQLQYTNYTHEIIRKSSKLGYRLIGVPFHKHISLERINEIRDICQEFKLDFATRIDLKPEDPKDLLSSLRSVRRKFEIVAVICKSKDVTLQASKDRRVDLINFPSFDFRKRFFNSATAELASHSLTSFEIDMNPLFLLEGRLRSKLLLSLRKEVALAIKKKVPIILSSGTSNTMFLRKPKDIALISSLFDLDEDLAIQSISKNPFEIIKRNREKLSPDFIAPGIRLIRGDKNC